MNNRNLRCSAELNRELRMLWSQHVYRTRFFIISTAADLGDLQFVTKWLLENPGDFAAVFRRFYGRAVAEEFKKLFTSHLMIAGDLVNALKNGDTAKADAEREKWYENADEIADFLSIINPCQSREKWIKLMHGHLKMTENEAALRLAGRFPEDIAEFNSIEQEALKMADYMTEGFVCQFQLC